MIKLLAVWAALVQVLSADSGYAYHPALSPTHGRFFWPYGAHMPLAHHAILPLGQQAYLPSGYAGALGRGRHHQLNQWGRDHLEEHHQYDHSDDHQESFLTCRVSVGGEQLAVNVRNRKYSPYLTGHGAHVHDASGLEVSLEVVTATAGDYVLAFTERALTEDCTARGMGYFAHPLINHPTVDPEKYPGEIITHRLLADTKYATTVERAGGYTSLTDLAGRGVVVCPSGEVEHDGKGHYTCGTKGSTDPAGASCCGLIYTNVETALDLQ